MDANNKYSGHSMKHSELDLFDNVFDKLEEENASSQNMGVRKKRTQEGQGRRNVRSIWRPRCAQRGSLRRCTLQVCPKANR